MELAMEKECMDEEECCDFADDADECVEMAPEVLVAPPEDLSEPLDEPQSEDEEDSKYEPPVALHATGRPMVDFAKIPSDLEARLGSMDPDGALRPTILNTGLVWAKKSQQGLLGPTIMNFLADEDQKKEKNDAFDLLDALTRSGVLPFDEASLHVVVCSTHCFDETVMNCLVKRNINPIEKVERSTLIVASTVHGVSAETVVNKDKLDLVKTYCPTLFSAKSLS